MPNANSKSNAQLIERIAQARQLLDEALSLARRTTAVFSSSKAPATTQLKIAANALDFSMPMRAFIKKYSKNMNGAKKFTLLVAYLTRGDSGQTVVLADVEKNWNKMTAKGLLGMKFNRWYSSQAKENDWTDAETGSYHLRPSWKNIFA